MAQSNTARCRNRVNCDLGLSGELIEVPQDGRCPECRQPLQAEAGNGGSPTDEARRKRMLLMALGGGLLSLCVAIFFMPTDPEPVLGNDTPPIATNTSEVIKPPAPPLPPATKPDPVTPSVEPQQHIKQGMTYVSLAKLNPKTRTENIKNALLEFDIAVKQEEAKKHCPDNAYMNRGLANWVDNKPNLAEIDLVKAKNCNGKDPNVYYNLAAYYAAVNKTDLALEPMNKAFELGFDDCEMLRKDSDLKKLRKQKDFLRILEKHKLFCFK